MGFGRIFQRFLIFFRKHAQTCGSQQDTAWAHESLRSAHKKTSDFCHKTAKERCEFMTRKKQAPKLFKNLIWEGLGLHLEGVWDALERLAATFGRILTA